MSLIRIATPSTQMDATNAIILETDQVTITITRGTAEGLSAAAIEGAIRTAAGAHPLPDIFAHVNRDGSIAIATGTEPSVWPEDAERLPEPPE